MMPIINIHPLPSEEKAESFRLSLKNADKFGLYCCHDGTSAMWSVIPKVALELIFNAETALPVTERTWVDLTRAELAEILCDDRWQGRPELMLLQAQSQLKERNS